MIKKQKIVKAKKKKRSLIKTRNFSVPKKKKRRTAVFTDFKISTLPAVCPEEFERAESYSEKEITDAENYFVEFTGASAPVATHRVCVASVKQYFAETSNDLWRKYALSLIDMVSLSRAMKAGGRTYFAEAQEDLWQKYAEFLTNLQTKYNTTAGTQFNRYRTWANRKAEREVILFQQNNFSAQGGPAEGWKLSFKPFLVYQGLAVFALLLISAIAINSIFFPAKIDEANVIKTAQTQKMTPVVAESQPIQWSVIIKRSDITNNNYFLKLPKSASNIKVSSVTKQQAMAVLATKLPSPQTTLTTEDRKQLTKISSDKNNLLASLFNSVKFLFADLEQSAAGVIEKIKPDKDEPKVKETKDAKVVDLSVEEEKEEKGKEEPSSSVPTIVSTTEDGNSEAVEITETAPAGSNDLQTPAEIPADIGSPPTSEYVQVTYETPAPNITEETIENGKRVTVSSSESNTQNLTPNTYTDVLAFTTIPEIYKVGQEDKIKIKWSNNGNQEMVFTAFDLNNNGKLDYVEWTVPHLSDQIFEIIFISKAWRLDSSKNIQEDIYDQVATQDGNYATINNGEYVRVTFQATLEDHNDITIYAKPTIGTSDVPTTIEVWAMAPSSAGSNDVYQEQLVATFPAITSEGTYKIYLTNLETPTDVFDLRIRGNLDIDYIVDPVGWLTGWAHRKKITIDNANVDADLTDFPTLIKITADADLATALSTGYDVRFTTSGGSTLLKYERESWTGGGGASATANFWVKSDIDHDADTVIYMYYGKNDAPDGADPTNVWDSNFKGVWHLKEATGANDADSTSNANTGTPTHSPVQADGKVDGSLTFDGANDYVTVSESFDVIPQITQTAWIYLTSYSGDSSTIVSKMDLFFFQIGSTGKIDVYEYGTTPSGYHSSDGSVSLNQWNFVAYTYNGSVLTMYINGNESGTVNKTGDIDGPGAQPTYFGSLVGSGRYFTGSIDEARISTVARAAAWIKFEYNNQGNADNEIAFAAQENNLTWLSGWSNRKKITIDHTKVGATTEDQTNFPVLISLSDITGANTNGTDIRFTADDGGTYLAREIESYASNTLVAWVKIPVLSHDYDTSIYMYWGNSSASEPAADSTYGSQNVWDANYKGVYHLKETGTGAAGDYKDSTSNANNSTNTTAQPTVSALGKIGNAQSFDGIINNITATSPAMSTFTLSAWVYLNADISAGSQWQIWTDSNSGVGLVIYANDGMRPTFWDGTWDSSSQAIVKEQWYHLVYTRGEVSKFIYIDGTQRATQAIGGNSAAANSQFGYNSLDSSRYFNGLIDDVQISNSARSAGWISTEYANQNSPSTFYTTATTESHNLDWLSGWSNRKKITIKHTNVDETLTNFPLLVKFTNNPDLKANAQADGGDFRFTSSDGTTLLSFEIESLTQNTTSTDANIWVKVPSISNTDDTDLWMYYGNSSASDGQDATNVWDSNFKGVWHLPDGSTLGALDSTSNNNDGTITGATATTGKIDGAGSFDGSSWVSVAHSATFNILQDISLSGWVKTVQAENGYILAKNDDSFYMSVGTGASGKIGFYINGVTTGWKSGTSDINDGQWHYVAATRIGTAIKLFVDGVLDGTDTCGGGDSQTGTNSVIIGSRYAEDSRLTGSLDEVRVSNTARSASWIKFEYANMNSSDNELIIEGASTGNGITWTNGSGDNLWSTASNWQGGVVPSTSDVAVFNASAVGNCTIDTNISTAGINITNGYTGTITQSSSYTVTVGTEGWTQAGGTFTGGDSAITLNGNYTLSGGTFTSTSGTMNTGNFTHTAGGTFNHNGGTVVIGYGWENTVDVATTETFHNLTINPIWNVFVTAGDTLVVDGTLTLAKQVDIGTIEAKGPISATPLSGGTATLIIDGAGDQSFTLSNGVKLPNVTLNSAATTITVASGATVTMGVVTLQSGAISISSGTVTTGIYSQSSGTFSGGAATIWTGSFTLSGGTFTATSGTMNTGNFTHTAGGTFNHNGGTIVLSAGWTVGVDVATTETFHNLTINPTWEVAVSTGDTLVVEGTLVLNHAHAGISGGTIDAKGAISVDATFVFGGTSALTLTGSTAQTITNSGGTMPSGTFTINKTSGTATLASNLVLNTAGQDLALQSGTLDLAGYDLTVADTFTVGGTLKWQGDETITAGTTTISAGSTVQYAATSGTNTIQNWAYHNFTINGAGGTFNLPANTTVNGNLAISAGTLDATTSNYNLTVNGSWTQTGGTFTPRAGTVTMNGGGTITAIDNFNNLTFTAADAVASSNLKGWWKFDDASGTSATDSSGNGNTGTLTGATWTTGILNGALSFDGNGNFVSLGNPASLRLISSFSLSAWVKPADITGGFIVVKSQGCLAYPSYFLGQTSDQAQLRIYPANSAGYSSVTSTTSLGISNWHFVTATFDGSNMHIFIDGNNEATTASTDTPWDTPDNVEIGGDNGCDSPTWDFAGLIDDVRIYNTALTAAQVRALASGNEPGYTLASDIAVSGNFTNTAGTFNTSTKTVTLASGTHTVTGATTFYNLTLSPSNTITFPASTTQTITNTLTCEGTSGNVITINSSTPATSATLSKTSGTVTCDYLSLTDSAATGGAAWNPGAHSTNVSGGNSGWDFTAPTTTATATSNGASYTFNTWATANVTVTLTCADNEGGTGCSTTKYCTDTTNTCTPTTTYDSNNKPAISAETITYIRYYSTDTVPNTETTKSSIIKIDKTNPSVSAGSDQTKTALFTQDATTSDATSGIASYLWEKVSGTGTITFGTATAEDTTISANLNGTYEIRLTVTDNAGNSATDDFTLTWQGGTGGSTTGSQPTTTGTQTTAQTATPAQETPLTTIVQQIQQIPQQIAEQVDNLQNQITEQINNLKEQAQIVINLLYPSIGEQAELIYPDISVSVPKEPQVVFQGGNLIPLKQFEKISILPLPDSIKNLALKFPSFATTLEKVGISKPEDVEKLQVAKLSFPSLSEVAGVPSNLLFAEFTDEQKQKIPSNITFARTGADNIDFNIKVSVADLSAPVQSIATIQNKPLFLTVKPDAPASSVKGYIIFKSANSQSAFLDWTSKLSGSLSASLLDATNLMRKTDEANPANDLPEVVAKKDIVLSEFDYVNNNGIWTAETSAPNVDGKYEVRTIINYREKTKNNKTTESLSMILVVDPEGYVYEKVAGGKEARISNAKVSIHWLNPKTQKYELWPGKDYQQENPQITDVTGKYSFLVPPGTYYLKIESQDYLTYEGKSFQVEEGKGIHENIELKAKNVLLRMFTPERIMLGMIIILLGAILIFLYLSFRKNFVIKGRNQQTA